MPSKHPLTKPRSAAALSLLAIPTSIVVPLLLPQYAGVVVLGCYATAALLCWLCRSEIKGILMRLRGESRSAPPEGDFWVTAVSTIIVFLLGTYLWTYGVPAFAQTSPSINGNCNIVGTNNTTNCVFNQAPKPDLKILGKLSTKANPDRTFTTAVMISVHPQVPVVATACGDQVLSISMAIWTGIMAGESIPRPAKDNCRSTFYDGVYGDWVVNVVTGTETAEFGLKLDSF